MHSQRRFVPMVALAEFRSGSISGVARQPNVQEG